MSNEASIDWVCVQLQARVAALSKCVAGGAVLGGAG
jgi:hypothetical protein